MTTSAIRGQGGSSTTKRDGVPALCQRSPSLIFYDLLDDSWW
ncbi:hypothetical protein [Nostoc sp. C110]